MKQFVLPFLVLILCFSSLNAELILDKQVNKFDTYINLTLNNSAITTGNSSKMHIISYSFYLNNNNPIINETSQSIGQRNISIEKAPESEFVVVRVIPENGNYSETLPIIIYQNNQPVQNSYYFKSLYEVNALNNYNNSSVNYIESLQDIDLEIKNYPNNLIALLTKQSMNNSTNIIDSKIKSLISSPQNLSEKELLLLYNIYTAEEKKSDVDEISKIILKKYPLGNLSEQNFYTKLSAKKSNEYIQLANIFIKQYPNSSKKNEVIDKIAQIYIENSDLEAAKSILESNNYIPPFQALRLAFAYLEKKNSRADAEKMFETIITRLKNNSNISRNSSIPEYQWKIDLNNYLAETYRAFGEYFLQTKQPKRAIDYILLAKDLFVNPPAKLYENLAIAFYNSKLDNEALNVTEQAFASGFDTKIIKDINQRTFNYLFRNREYDKYYDSLSFNAKITRQNSIYAKLVNEDIKLPVLKNKDDIIVDLSLMRKDILVIELFSSWCEPCENSLLSFSEINQSLKSGNNISMIAINTFENQKLDNKIFNIDDLKGLQVFFDTDGDFARTLGITGLPVRLFIDKYGKLRYIQNGAIGKEEDIRETKDVMELLNNLQ